MTIDHYENFPVASVLCPPRLRPAVRAIYWFARTADDLADEGDAPSDQRLADLASYRRDLHALYEGTTPSERWGGVMNSLKHAAQQHALPLPLLDNLLDAFVQDVVKQSYQDRNELLDYCKNSANPVGRLLLHLYGITESSALRESDDICSALQLINFWQDLSIDIPRGRIYLPATDCAKHGITPTALSLQADSPSVRAMIAELAHWARGLMINGQALVHKLPGRAGWELRLVVQGGLRILEKMEKIHFRTLLERPTLRWSDGPFIAWNAWLMHPPMGRAQGKNMP